MLAVKSARDLWRAADPARAHARPTLVLPTTAHPAFHKAAHYLDLDVVPVPVDPATGTPSAADVLAVVDERTALVVVSAPSYPFGAIDPVAEVAAGAAARGVACHVDACVGGWVLPWWGDVDQPWDLAVPGVTSISADLHKFGYAPKGASVVLYRARERHHAQYFATTAWPGYPVVNPTMLGSRGAGSMAAAWAVLQVLGHGRARGARRGHAPGDRSSRRGGRRRPRAAGRRGARPARWSRSPRTTPCPPPSRSTRSCSSTRSGVVAGCSRRSPRWSSRTARSCRAPPTSPSRR